MDDLEPPVLSDDNSDSERKLHYKDTMGLEHGRQTSPGLQCSHESHEATDRPVFATEAAKIEHLVQYHRCAFANLPQKCGYYAEYQYQMNEHVLRVHAKRSHLCIVCNRTFDRAQELAHHIKIHPQCLACEQHFLSSQQLYDHHPSCMGTLSQGGMAAEKEQPMEGFGAALKIIAAHVNSGTRIDDSTLKRVEQSVNQYIDNAKIERQRQIQGNAQIIKTDVDLFDLPIPETDTTQKEDTGRISQFFKPEDSKVVNPEEGNTLESAIRNYFLFSAMLEELARVTHFCHLREKTVVTLLSTQLAGAVRDTLEHLCGNDRFTDLSLHQIVSTIQFTYLSGLDLKLYETAVLGMVRAKKENFVAFSTRLRKALKLVSRSKPRQERNEYIDRHHANILFQNCPPALRAELLRTQTLTGHKYSGFELVEQFQVSQVKTNPPTLKGISLPGFAEGHRDTMVFPYEDQRLTYTAREASPMREEGQESEGHGDWNDYRSQSGASGSIRESETSQSDASESSHESETSQDGASENPELPKGWEIAYVNHTEVGYVNQQLGKFQKEHPALPEGWEEIELGGGQIGYVNQELGKFQVEPPVQGTKPRSNGQDGSSMQGTKPRSNGQDGSSRRAKRYAWVKSCLERLGIEDYPKKCFRCLSRDCDFTSCIYKDEGRIEDDWLSCSQCRGGLHLRCKSNN